MLKACRNTVNTMANAAASRGAERRPFAARKTRRGRPLLRAGSDEIAKRLNADIEAGRIPGAVIAIARKGKLVYYETFGFRDKAAGVAMTQGHDLQHRLDDQADGRGRGAAAARARQAADRRSARRSTSRSSPTCRSPSSTRRARRSPARCRRAQPITLRDLMMHTSGPDLWRPRQHGGAQALSGEQLGCRRVDDRRRVHGQARDAAAAAISPARSGTTASGSTCSAWWSRRCPEQTLGQYFAGQHLQAARHDRHACSSFRPTRPRATPRRCRTIPRPAGRRRCTPVLTAAAEVRMRRRLPVLHGRRLHALRADAAEQGRLWRDAHPRAQDRRIHADEPARARGEEPDRPTPTSDARGLRLRPRPCGAHRRRRAAA